MGWWPFGDKVGHFLLYSIFGLALGWGCRNLMRKGVRIGVVLTGVLFAASDEWHQAFVPRREPSFGDFWADAAGILVGYLVISFFLKRLTSTKKTTNNTRV